MILKEQFPDRREQEETAKRMAPSGSVHLQRYDTGVRGERVANATRGHFQSTVCNDRGGCVDPRGRRGGGCSGVLVKNTLYVP